MKHSHRWLRDVAVGHRDDRWRRRSAAGVHLGRGARRVDDDRGARVHREDRIRRSRCRRDRSRIHDEVVEDLGESEEDLDESEDDLDVLPEEYG